MSAPPYPPPGARTLQRQYTGLADTFSSALQDGGMSTRKLSAVDATNRAAPAAVFQPIVAGVTDPGVPGKQNQDDFFIWQSEDGQSIVMGVLDGHGRELGQMAARVAKESMLSSLASPAGLARLRADPKTTMDTAFVTAHAAIEDAFRRYYEANGWTVSKGQGRDAYLIRQKGGSAPAQCVHGGTTATIVVLLDGQRLVVSNVGDSTALLCGIGEAGTLRSVEEWTPLVPLARRMDTSASSAASSPSTGAVAGHGGQGQAQGQVASKGCSLVTNINPAEGRTYMEVSADHSPESPEEFQRMHRFRPHASLPHRPELLFVYDTLTAHKTACPPIFEVDAAGVCNKTERGSYYKNVRCEWASLVSTPPHAAFQDALAFTRSLGDLHLQVYGVTHMPETWWIDLVVPEGGSGGAAADAPFRSDSPDSMSPLASALQSKLELSQFELDGSSAGSAASSPALRGLAGASAGAPAPGSPSAGLGPGVGAGAPVVPRPLSIVLCSDGIWDNWRFEDVATFALTRERVDKVARSGSAEAACNELMAANLDRARVNFGSSADNMTAITLYLLPRA